MSIFGGKSKTQATTAPTLTGLDIQTSVRGKALALCFGTRRAAPNLIWYGDFIAIPHQSNPNPSGAGKGAATGTGGGGKGGATGGVTYTYQTAVAMALCEGPIVGFGRMWASKSQTTLSAVGFSAFLGTYPQSPWNYFTTSNQTSQTTAIPGSAPYTITVAASGLPIQDFGVVDNGQQHVTAGSPGGFNPLTIVVNGGSAIGSDGGVIDLTTGQAMAKIDAFLLDLYPGSYAVDIATGTYTFNTTGTNVQISWSETASTFTAVVGAPAAGEYSVDLATGVYTFNSADAGLIVEIRYAPYRSDNRALGYNGIAYVAAGSYDLGQQAQLPQHTIEVKGIHSDSLSNGYDADASLVVTSILSDPAFGAGFPASLIGDLTTYQDYVIAAGLWISPLYTDQVAAAEMIREICELTNSEPVWSSGLLTIVPRGDEAITANGHTYTPPSTPIFDFNDNDFIAKDGDDPVICERERPADQLNEIKLEWLDRDNDYNAAIASWKDQASIDRYGLRTASARQAGMFCIGDAANLCAALLGARQAVRNKYRFTVGQRYIALDPMDIVTITDPGLGLSYQWVRILEIEEDDNFDLSILAEEYLAGTGSANNPIFQRPDPFSVDYNQAAGAINPPVIFEPPFGLTDSQLEVWVGISGTSTMGGADVWVSEDGAQYRNIGRITNPSRQGQLTAILPLVSPAIAGDTIDQTNTLSVDLSISRGSMLEATQQDATAFNTLCYVDGELISYWHADLTGLYNYDLSYLVRGCFATTIAAHQVGTDFLRIDESVLSIPFTEDKIGTTIYIKFLPFNQYGGGQSSLADVSPYSYLITGAALSLAPADVENFRSAFIAGQSQLVWDMLDDPRDLNYEVRKGPDWETAFTIGAAHSTNTMLSQGDGEYWIKASFTLPGGMKVYSENATGLELVGATLEGNVMATYDEKALGWPGTLTGDVAIIGDDLCTGGSGDFLGVTDFLGETDFLNEYNQGGGSYEIPSGHIVNVGRVAPCEVIINWSSAGELVTADFLAQLDFLANTEILGANAGAYTDVYPMIGTSLNGVDWTWQKYVPGVYLAQYFSAKMIVQSLNPIVRARCTAFIFQVDVPDRIEDHNVAIGPSATAITYPDGAFNGGSGNALGSYPNPQVTLLSASAGDDVVITSVTASGFTVQVLNGGVGQSRNINYRSQGW